MLMSKATPPFDFNADPFELFTNELTYATTAGMPEPNAMTLATVAVDGTAHARTVYLKGYSGSGSDLGFRLFTNYHSEKAKDLTTGSAALLFHWARLEQQVRIQGVVEKTSREESEEYFNTRARISQLGAWASEQSKEIDSFEWLDKRLKEFEKKYEGQSVPCPPHWGGYRVIPLQIEFWFGRTGRLHERYVFERTDAKTPWRRYLKSP